MLICFQKCATMKWNIDVEYIKPHSKGNGRTGVLHHQTARRPVQQHRFHDDNVARIVLEGHCAHRRMIWFYLLSLGAEEADQWVLASTTWFLSVYVWKARHTTERQWDGWGPFILQGIWCAVGPVESIFFTRITGLGTEKSISYNLFTVNRNGWNIKSLKNVCIIDASHWKA